MLGFCRPVSRVVFAPLPSLLQSAGDVLVLESGET